MKVGQILKDKDFNTYKKLHRNKQNKKIIRLGDSPVDLMKSRSYKRVNGAIRQTSWE